MVLAYPKAGNCIGKEQLLFLYKSSVWFNSFCRAGGERFFSQRDCTGVTFKCANLMFLLDGQTFSLKRN